MSKTLLLFPLFLVFSPLFARAEFDLDCYIKNDCRSWRRSSSSSPSSGSQVRINPSVVPTEKGFGIEGIYFDDSIDVAFVQGLGRVGAAISPSNSEETFFGPPGYEHDIDFLERHVGHKKYPNQKYTLAAATKLIERWGSGLSQFNLNLGLMAKYNKYTTNVSPGAGLSGTFGFLTFGGSYYKDESQLDGDLPKELRPKPIAYTVQTYNVGMFLKSLILDYSHMQTQDEASKAEIQLYTASLLVSSFIFTVSKRHETSWRPHYNSQTQMLEYQPEKEDMFGGIQYSFNRNFMMGVFYNYYLLEEGSISATVFF